MGKRVKKKAARNAHKEKEKEKRVSISSPKAVPQEDNQSSVIADDGPVVLKERKVCIHLDKAIDLGTVSSKIESAESSGCEYCREGVNDRKAGKGKGKGGKKKGASDSIAESKATWVCLQCGNFSCGGVGFPNSPQSHALRHARQSRHPLVMQVENPHLRWCFSCSSLIPVDKMEDPAEQKDVLLDIVKLLKKKSSKGPSVDVEDIWFGSGSVVSELTVESKAVSLVDGKDAHAVRGLVNLGNTCFFNSVMQNLLAMDTLREYLLKFDGPMGPLTSALKKIFVETSLESGLRNAINPRPLFGCVCAKAPQFRGYQQQDSHELLRYLLDGLSSEDLYAKKSESSENGVSLPVSATYVDAIFGGQTSSTVQCVDCGHSSVVYEPFLDLSLPVPTKKPLSKKAQPVPRTKKKMPPKRGGKIRPKSSKNGDVGLSSSRSNTSTSTYSSSGLKGNSLSCASSADHVEPSSEVHRNAIVSQSASQDADSGSCLDYVRLDTQGDGVQEADSFAWMDYLEPVSLLDDPSLVVEDEKISGNQGLGSHDANDCAVSVQYTARSSLEASLSQDHGMKVSNHDAFSAPDTPKSDGEVIVQTRDVNLKSGSTVDDCADERPVQVQDNEILLLTYKEDGATAGEGFKVDAEISSSALGDVEETLGFDGLGDLFNEPETVEVGVKNTQGSEHLGNGFLVGNSTESDPDEVDDTYAPVSVESCLAHFIKPELLSGEHAWHCENCSKLFKEGRKKTRKDLQNTVLYCKDISSDQCSSSEVLQETRHPFLDSSAVLLANHINGSSDTDENLKELDARPSNSLSPNLPLEEEKRCVPDSADFNASVPAICLRPSDESIIDGNSVDSLDVDVVANHVCAERPSRIREEQESGEDVEKEVDLKCVKVMRDATKRILISKTPPILTIHLKRFGQDARGRLSKLNGHVGFKEFIDLGPYMDCRSTERDKCIYRLVGVVEHSGSMRGGHYVAYVRGGDRRKGRSIDEETSCYSVWYHASDAYVRETTLEEVLRCEAYILFYEKVKP